MQFCYCALIFCYSITETFSFAIALCHFNDVHSILHRPLLKPGTLGVRNTVKGLANTIDNTVTKIDEIPILHLLHILAEIARVFVEPFTILL